MSRELDFPETRANGSPSYNLGFPECEIMYREIISRRK